MTISAFLDNALHAIADSFTPLSNALTDVDSFRDFLSGFGWEFDPAVDEAQFAIVGQIFSAEKVLLDALPNADTAALAVVIPALLTSLLKNWSTDPAWPTPLNAVAFWSGTATDAGFPRELVDSLLYDIVADRVPVGFGLLRLVGVFDEEARPAVTVVGTIPERAAYTRRAIDWSRLGPAISHPESIFETVYHWNDVGGAFEHAKLLRNIGALFEGFPLGVAVVPTSTAVRELYFDPVQSSPASLDQLTVLPLSYQTASGPTFGSMKLSLNTMPIPPAGMRTGQPGGIAVFPLVSGQVQNSVTLSDGITATLSGAYATIPVLAEIRPTGITFNVPQGATGTLDAEVRVDAHANAAPWLLLGTADATRLELSQAHLSLKAQGALTDPEFTIEIGLDSVTMVVDFSQGDSFLQSVFGSEAQRSELALAVAWSNKTGFRIRGQARLEVSIPIHQTILGAITLDTIFLVLEADVAGRIILEAAVSGFFALGPIKATVDRVGLMMPFAPANSGSGNLGLVNLNLGFRPPNGLGLVIDTSVIVGGGYLLFDPTNEQYAGVLQLEIKDVLSLKAIGLLTTRLPDGSKGFSLLVIITAEFPPIELGFGFTLTGVGGLLGVNRTMNLDVLRAGVKNHTLDSILFPQHPVANAARIISDLQSVFPPVSGRFVFGPMAKLAWGKPTIMTLELGIVLELPSPARLAIMGQLKLVLPSQEVEEELQIVVLHLDVLGTIDFGTSDAAIDATLYNSHIAKFPISGDMALRLNWGASPTFALSVGGFNPRFQPPPKFPALARLTIALATRNNARLRFEAYLALTSNTVQFGARLDIYAETQIKILTVKNTLSVAAYLGFDALVHFPPFSFVVDIEGGVTIKLNGNPLLIATLYLTLSGPEPWHAYGQVTFDVLGLKCGIAVDLTIGDEPPPMSLPPGDPLEELRKALADPRNWSAQLPKDGHMLVTLRKIAVADEVLMHPFGELTFRQKAVPLDTTISKFGSTTPNNPGPFTFSDILFDGQSTHAKRQTVRDSFAPGQFFELSDEDKLALPAFQPLPSGCTGIGTAAISHSTVLSASFQYDTVVIDNKEELAARRGQGFAYAMAQPVLLAAAELGAAAQSAMRSTGSAKFAGDATQKVGLKDPEYVIASTEDMAWAVAPKQPSYVEAAAVQKQQGAASKHYQVVGSHEVV